MTALDHFASSADEYALVVAQASRLVDIHADPPTWPFVERGGMWDVCDHAWFGEFENVLFALGTHHGDEFVSIAMVRPQEALDSMALGGEYPAFTLKTSQILQTYGNCISTEVGGLPTEILTASDRVLFGGSSGKWSIWVDHGWEVAVVYAKTGPAVWRNQNVEFVDSFEDIVGQIGLAINYEGSAADIASFAAALQSGGRPGWADLAP